MDRRCAAPSITTTPLVAPVGMAIPQPGQRRSHRSICSGSVLAFAAWSAPVLISGRFVAGCTGKIGHCGDCSA
jgi:hypothetical protein